MAQTSGLAWEPIVWDKGVNITYGRVKRNYATYPSPASDATFYAAIGAGSLPVEERAGPAWASARITYLGAKNHLEVEVQATATVVMKFERVDGQALSGGNPDGVVLQSGVYYPNGPSGQPDYTKRWVFGQDKVTGAGGIPSVPIRLTLKNTDTGAEYSAVFKPLNRASRTTLVRASGATTPTTPTTPSTGTPTASYFANGFGEGSYAQLVQQAPFVPSVNQLASWPTGNTTQYLSNGVLKLGLLKSVGASLSHLSLNGGQNLVNTNANGWSTTYEGEKAPDVGRSGGFSTYGNPDGFRGGTGGRFVDINDYGQSETSSNIGWNAVQGGSEHQNHSPILWYERRVVDGVEWIYTKTQPYQWGMVATKAKQYVHQWWSIAGREARWVGILENFRDDTQMRFEGRQQELPFIYPIAPLYRKVTYTGASPFSGGGLTYFDLPEPTEGGDERTNQNDTGNFVSSENWVGAVNPDGSTGVFLLTPYNNRFHGKQFQRWGGDEYSNASSYINAGVMLNFDHAQCLAYSGSVYVGSLAEFRSWVGANRPASIPFSFSFGAGRSCGWWSENGPARFIDNRYSFNIGYGRPGDAGTPLEGTTVHFATFASPFGAWQAGDIPTIYIKGRFTGTNITNLVLAWRKPGAEGSEYNKPFTAAATTNEQTIAIPMNGTADWSGIISNIRIKLANSQQQTSGSEMFIPTYIGNVNPG